MAARETFDVSPSERKVIEARHARRTALRHEYLKQIHNPYRYATGEGGSVFDAGLQRFSSMRATANAFFRPTPQNSLFYFGCVIAPIAVVMYVVVKTKNASEHLLRTGQVSYRDREFKFT